MTTTQTTETATTTETLDARLTRLSISPSSEGRRESLALAHAAGVDDTVLARIAAAVRLKRNSSSVLIPALHLEGLSRGSGWCRQGKGAAAVWAEREDGCYRVTSGRWTLGATDGFRRSAREEWRVENLRVGVAVWTIASKA